MTTTPGLLPFRPDVEDTERVGALIGIDDPGKVFEVLASGTARAILGALYQDPGPASDVANRVGTSLQNAAYHLKRLVDAGLVTTIDTWYSAKGKEMNVYAPANDPLVLYMGGVSSLRVIAQLIEDADPVN